MRRICPNCDFTYDDYDHWTFCPHDSFGASPSVQAMIDSGELPQPTGLAGAPRKPTEEERLEFPPS